VIITKCGHLFSPLLSNPTIWNFEIQYRKKKEPKFPFYIIKSIIQMS
jgi:hypothetical protein